MQWSSAGASGWEGMAASVGKAGAATRPANARMSGMRGAIEYWKDLDSFMIGTVLPFADSISGALRGVADMVTAFGNLPEPVDKRHAWLCAGGGGDSARC